MTIDLKSIKEIIDINASDLCENRELTNDLVVDDILLELGYDKKRNRGVRRVYNGDIDWKVDVDGEKRFVVKTVEYGRELRDTVEIDRESKEYNLVIVTNGERMNIYRKDDIDEEPIFSLDLLGDNTAVDILRYIQMSDYSIDKIDAIYDATLLKSDYLEDVINNNIDTICNTILKMSGYKEIKKNIRVIRNRILNTDSNTEYKDVENDNSLMKVIDGLNNKIYNLNDKIKCLNDDKKIYEKKIEELNNELKDAKKLEDINKGLVDEVDNLNNEVLILRERIKQMTSSNKRYSRGNSSTKALLDGVLSGVDVSKIYAGVVNNKVYTHEDIRRFIGMTIEELYSIEGFRLMPILFNGDIFRFIQPAQRKDFIISGKVYDINTDGLEDSDLLEKLDILFSEFKNVVYDYRVIERQKDNAIDDREISIYADKLISIKLSELGNIVNNSRLNTIEFIECNDRVFRVASCVESKDELYNSIMVSKVIDSLLNLSNDIEKSIEKIKQVDFSGLNKNVELINNYNRKNPRISFTRYIINDNDLLNSYIGLISVIAELIGINKDEVVVYARGEFKRGYGLEEYFIEDSNVSITENTEYSKQDGVENTFSTVISGNLLEQTTMTLKSMRIQDEIFKKCEAIKTSFISSKLDTDEDISNVFRVIIEKGIESGKDFDPLVVGKVLNSEQLIISDYKKDVNKQSIKTKVGDKIYYINKLHGFQLMYALIRLYSSIFKDTNINIKVRADKDIYEFYRDEFIVSEPTISLSVKSVIDYLKKRD